MSETLSSHASVARRTTALLVLLFVALIASVLVPGRETSRVGELLDEDEQLIEPARISARRAAELIMEEASEGRRYAASADSAAVQRLRTNITLREQDLAVLHALSARLKGEIARAVNDVSPLIDHWRSLNRVAEETAVSLIAFRDSAGVREAVSDSLVVALSRVQAELANWSARQRDGVRAHEHRGLLANIALVLGALGAMVVVIEVGRRERRRAWQEAALRTAAESMTRALTVDEVARRVARTGLELLSARGVCVEHLESRSSSVLVVQATDGDGVPSIGVESPLVGSVAERAILCGRPVIVAGELEPRSSTLRASSGAPERILAIPLGRPGAPFGVVFALESKSRPFQHQDLPVAAIFGELASLTYERVRLLHEARAARSRLERALDSRSRLMRGFSHDVKNPLGAAMGYAELLADGVYGKITDSQRLSLDRIRQATKRALSLIDDLHELARAETGNVALHLARTNIAELVGILGDEYRAAAQAKRLQLIADSDPALPSVDTDVSRIRQIVANLLSNAIKFTDTGSVSLTAQTITPNNTDGGAYVVVSVTDTGPGISRQQMARLFQEFARGEGQDHPGAGLGLAISKLLADALGCQIHVTSDVGRGSTFSLHIPAALPLDRDKTSDVAQHQPQHDRYWPVLPNPPTRLVDTATSPDSSGSTS